MSTLVERVNEIEIDDDDRLYEVINGQRVEKPVGAAEVLLANELAYCINQYGLPLRTGTVAVEVLIDIGHPDRNQFRPDLIYVSADRWPRGRKLPPGNAWSIVPDLTVEVVSPSNSAEEIRGKIELYLKAGVRQVWVVYPRQRRIEIHDHSSIVRVVGPEGAIEGGEVLPGFRLPLADLFGDASGPG